MTDKISNHGNFCNLSKPNKRDSPLCAAVILPLNEIQNAATQRCLIHFFLISSGQASSKQLNKCLGFFFLIRIKTNTIEWESKKIYQSD